MNSMEVVEVSHKCPHCGVVLKGVPVTRPTLVRCPVSLVEGDRAREPALVAYVCSQLGVARLPWVTRCGRLFTRYPQPPIK